MPAGDYGPGTKGQLEIVNIGFDKAGQVTHCGLGFYVVLPSGKRVPSGHTWGGPDAQPPEPYRSRLQELMDELIREAFAAEGISGLA